MSIFSILNHPCSFMVFIISLVFSFLSKVLFSGFLQFKDNFVKYSMVKITLRDHSKATSIQINFLSYFFVKKIPLSRRDAYVMDWSMG